MLIGVEPMETRLCMSAVTTGPAAPLGSGVDSIAMGDVNGSQLVDVAVASHQSGSYQVTIYSGIGQADSSLKTGYAPKVLATIPDPFSPAAGPLDVAMGDFTNNGISELAISSMYLNQIAVYTFQTGLPPTASPINATVTAVPMGKPFVPAGLSNARGINLAAVDTSGDGVYQLIATPATKGPGKLVVLSYTAQSGWQVRQTIGHVLVSTKDGLSVSAGDLTGSGSADIVVGSQADGRVAVYDMGLERWVGTSSPLGKHAQDVRVAVDTSEGQGASGSIIVTGERSGKLAAAIDPWQGKSRTFQLIASPGSGELVTLGAGYVYRPSTIVYPSDPKQFPYSPGPATPVGLFAATGGSQLVIQQFAAESSKSTSKASFVPSKPDTVVEPLWGDPGNGFIPMMVKSDPDATGQAIKGSASGTSPIDLVVLPYNAYNSPYSIDLSGVPASVTAGLLNVSAVLSSTDDPWGPARFLNTPPSITSQTTTLSLQERVIAAYESFMDVGLDYQHHYNALWSPSQQTKWNVTGTLAYQSQGVDCTNFTADAYADALGILLPGGTAAQGAITSNSDIYIPTDSSSSGPSIADWIHLQTFYPSSWGNTYAGLVKMLEPGDILYIDGSKGGKITHAITWLGQFGKDANGQDQYLIMDSTGITPVHVDSNGMVIPEGVHIRPFGDGDGSQPNSWYFSNIDHVLRIIGSPTS